MATTTPKLGLPRPEANDNVTLENEQALIDAIDSSAASQADLDAHTEDDTAHVTAAERAAWNAKETPAGAQAKADAAAATVQSNLDSHVGSGGTSHALATASAHGFMSSSDKTKLNGIETGAQKNTVTSVAGKTGTVSLDKTDVGLTNVDNVQQAPAARTINAGNGLSGGGDLTVNRTISLGTPGTLTTSSTNSTTATSHTHAVNFPVTSVAGKTGAVSLVKGDVGLGSVQNYGIATQAAAQAGTANNVYMTPLRTKQAIDSITGGVPLRVQNGQLEFYDGGSWLSVGDSALSNVLGHFGVFPFNAGSSDLTISSNTTWNDAVGYKRVKKLTINAGRTLTINKFPFFIFADEIVFGSTTSSIDASGPSGSASGNFSSYDGAKGALVESNTASGVARAQGGCGGGMLFVVCKRISGAAGSIKANGGNGYYNGRTSPADAHDGGEGALGLPYSTQLPNDTDIGPASPAMIGSNGTYGMPIKKRSLSSILVEYGRKGSANNGRANGGGGISQGGGAGVNNNDGTQPIYVPTIEDLFALSGYGLKGGGGGGAAFYGGVAEWQGAGGGGGGVVSVFVRDLIVAPVIQANGGLSSGRAGNGGAGVTYLIRV